MGAPSAMSSSLLVSFSSSVGVNCSYMYDATLVENKSMLPETRLSSKADGCYILNAYASAIHENNGLTVGEQKNAIQNFCNRISPYPYNHHCNDKKLPSRET